MNYWLNGNFGDLPQAINIADRGFLLGDGLFETILADNGGPVFLQQHLDRLRDSAAALALEVAYSDDEIRRAIADLTQRNGLKDGEAVVRITLTRGAGGRGLDLQHLRETPATLLITIMAHHACAAETAELIVSKYKRAEQSVSASHKTLAYIDNILARDEAVVAGADDAILLNGAGRIACASAANLFLILDDGAVRTPPVEEGALPGIVRRILLDEASKADIAISETPIEEAWLNGAFLFLTNSIMGLRPAVLASNRTETRAAAIDVLKRLQSCYDDAVRRDLTGG